MSNPKAQFQIDNGNGWQTIAEVDIIDGVVQPPNAWTMARVLHKQIVYTGFAPEEITVVPSKSEPNWEALNAALKAIGNTNERNTHFAGFAKALWQELLAVDEGHIDISDYNRIDEEMMEQYRAIIARRAYDLVQHTILNIGPADLDMLTTEECVQRVPDLTELPSEPQP